MRRQRGREKGTETTEMVRKGRGGERERKRKRGRDRRERHVERAQPLGEARQGERGGLQGVWKLLQTWCFLSRQLPKARAVPEATASRVGPPGC